jgi:L-asparagine transporter-like permease
MTKVSVVLYYWILIAAVLLFARTAGLAENNEAVIKIVIITTILYVGIAMFSRAKGKALDEKRAAQNDEVKSSGASAKRKKKHK